MTGVCFSEWLQPVSVLASPTHFLSNITSFIRTDCGARRVKENAGGADRARTTSPKRIFLCFFQIQSLGVAKSSGQNTMTKSAKRLTFCMVGLSIFMVPIAASVPSVSNNYLQWIIFTVSKVLFSSENFQREGRKQPIANVLPCAGGKLHKHAAVCWWLSFLLGFTSLGQTFEFVWNYNSVQRNKMVAWWYNFRPPGIA